MASFVALYRAARHFFTGYRNLTMATFALTVGVVVIVVAAVLGGIGNIPGAMLGGMLIGLMETWISATAYSTYRDAMAFAVLILILLFRPAGILGSSVTEKV